MSTTSLVESALTLVLRSPHVGFSTALTLSRTSRYFSENNLWARYITRLPDYLYEALTSERLKLFPNLEVLYVTSDKTLMDEDLYPLASLSELHLCPMRTSISGVALTRIPNLRSLHLAEWKTKVTDADIATLTQLRCLEIQGTRGIDPKNFLPSLTNLEELHLVGVGCDGIEPLLPNLKTLVVALNERGKKLKGVTEEQLVQCTVLRSLSLELNPISPSALTGLSNLEELYYCAHTKGDAPSYEEFPTTLPQLKRFNGRDLGRDKL